ncbi:DnaJ-domain-containing protein, partial [Neoconidiobolus thromboides FSU 785]
VCYYDLLEVNNDASDKEIKIAYRKQALVWHPDKNPTRNEEATFRFSKVQHAYQVLSDPQERAWYDENRDSILFGDGSSSNNDIGVAELMHYFSCLYVDYSDKPTGFYTVHRMLFEKLTKNEGNEEIKAVPSFGDSITPYSEIKKFYNFWENFSTDLEFTWYEEYNASQGPDRKARRYMEKENKKLRDNAKKEYNSTVRNLVLFIMKRDPRVKEYLDNKKKEKEKKENEKKEKIKDQKQKVMQSKLNSEYVTQDWSELNREDEEELKLLEEEWRINDSLVNSKKEEIIEDLYCIACNKDFNSVKQFEAHKLTKIHIKMIEKIKVEMMNDEMLFDS